MVLWLLTKPLINSTATRKALLDNSQRRLHRESNLLQSRINLLASLWCGADSFLTGVLPIC